MTDSGLKHLLNLPRLENLNLTGTSVTEIGITQLQSLPLSSLSVGFLPVTPESIAPHRNLRGLNLAGVNDVDNILEQASKLPNLLDVAARDGADISGAGVQHLQNAKRVYLLDFTGTELTDDDIKSLHKIASLTTIRLHKTKVTADGVEQLSKALPNCRIEWDGGVIEAEAIADEAKPEKTGEKKQ